MNIKVHTCGSVLHAITLRDIRPIKDLEELVEFTKYKNLLVATASHEFRTPLNGLLGMLTVL